jgi:hypothetical protein
LTIGSCATQTVATRSGSEGLGITPRISLTGSGVGARLWISYIGTSGEETNTNVFSGLRYCTTVASGSPNCESTPYFEKKDLLAADATFASRGHLIDSIKKVILIPQAMGENVKVGILSIGIKSDLLPSP